MKKIIIIIFLFLFVNLCDAKELVFDGDTLIKKEIPNNETLKKNNNTEITEIFCECIKKIYYKNRLIEDYDNLSFYIDDNKEKLYWSPSNSEVSGYPIRWDDKAISYSKTKGPEKTIGNININRQTGAFNMNFSDRYTNIYYVGKCSKVTNATKF